MAQDKGKYMKKIMKKIMLIVAVLAVMMAPAMAFACSYTFDVSLVSIQAGYTPKDATLGFKDWYVWTYEVKVVKGEVGHALSNWVLELPECYISSPKLFKEIEASASTKGTVNGLRVYSVEGFDYTDAHPEPTSGHYGLKWNQVSGDELDAIGEYEYFSFAVPTSQDIETDWAVKAGKNEVRDGVAGPDCPDCGPGSSTPEPVSLLLFGGGLFGVGFFRKRRATC